jgi:hypothetical protein
MAEENKTFMIEDARLLFRNFSGEKSQYNQNGARTFAAVLDPDVAEAMLKDGWNVKYLKEREEGEGETPYIPIEVKYKVKPPRITLITSKGRTPLGEDEVGILDWVDIETCDLIGRAYNWYIEATGKSGIKAYLQTMFVTIREDALERKYALAEQGE